MHLIDQLRQLGAKLPPSHVPSLNELAGVLGAVIAHAEHGDSILKAAEVGAEEVIRLLTPVAAEAVDVLVPAAAPFVAVAEQAAETLLPAPAAPAAPSTEGDQIAELRKQLEAAQTQIGVLQAAKVTTSEGAA